MASQERIEVVTLELASTLNEDAKLEENDQVFIPLGANEVGWIKPGKDGPEVFLITVHPATLEVVG